MMGNPTIKDKDKERRNQADFELLGRTLAIKLIDKLRSEKIPADMTYNTGNVIIRWSDLARQYEEENHCDTDNL